MKGNIITNHAVDIKRTIRYYQQFYANKLENLNGQEKQRKTNLLKLTQKLKVNLNNPIPMKENEPIIKDLPQKKSPGHITSLVTSKLTKK